jgi:hypothetical protein
MRRRTILSCMVIAGTVAGASAVGGVSPAAAQAAPPRWEQVAGNFFGDARDEEFFYVEGGTPDTMYTLSNGGVPGSTPLDIQFRDYNVTRTLDPFTGDFDGDGFDELFWYAPGSGADAMWNFTDIAHVTSKPFTVTGTYRPLVGDFNGDHVDDIFWYAPGSAADTLWYFRPGGSHVAVTLNVQGTYRAFVASIGKDATDDIVWYAPGTATDSVWDFTRGVRGHTTMPLTVNGNYRPIVADTYGDGPRGDDIWWYAPGSAADSFWDYAAGFAREDSLLPLGGNWIPTVGDFFGDGQEDVDLIDLAVGETIRDFATVDGTPVFFDYNFRAAAAAASADGQVTKDAEAGQVSEAQPFGR